MVEDNAGRCALIPALVARRMSKFKPVRAVDRETILVISQKQANWKQSIAQIKREFTKLLFILVLPKSWYFIANKAG